MKKHGTSYTNRTDRLFHLWHNSLLVLLIERSADPILLQAWKRRPRHQVGCYTSNQFVVKYLISLLSWYLSEFDNVRNLYWLFVSIFSYSYEGEISALEILIRWKYSQNFAITNLCIYLNFLFTCLGTIHWDLRLTDKLT